MLVRLCCGILLNNVIQILKLTSALILPLLKSLDGFVDKVTRLFKSVHQLCLVVHWGQQLCQQQTHY